MGVRITVTARALEAIGRLLEDLRGRSDRYRARYESYLDDMGTGRVGEGPLDHFPWEAALRRLEQSARAAGLVSDSGPAPG